LIDRRLGEHPGHLIDLGAVADEVREMAARHEQRLVH
jgi:hypothetical protein